MTAAMYASRYGLRTGLVERMMGGAQIINLERIEIIPDSPRASRERSLAP